MTTDQNGIIKVGTGDYVAAGTGRAMMFSSHAEVTVYLDSPNGPKAHYLGSMEIEAVLAALPAGWTVHEDAWQSAVQIDDLSWSVPLIKVD